jgi:uncharacterized membrane protein YbhN (UPF0104 family)
MSELERLAPAEEPAPRPRADEPRVRIRLFSSASDAKRARRPTDALRLVFSLIVIVACLVPAPVASQLDTATASLLQKIPGLFNGVWEISYDLMAFWAFFLLLATLLAHHRLRVFRDMALSLLVSSGLMALAAAQAGIDVHAATANLVAAGTTGAYFGVRLALATSLIVTAGPHMSDPIRRIGHWVLAIGALSSVALGAATATGAVAGFLIGIAGAATIHLLVGSPGGRLTLAQVAVALEELGVEAVDLVAGPLGPRGVAIVHARTPEGRPILIRVFGRDAQGGRLLASTWSSLQRRGELPQLGGGWQQVQHEALVSLFAERGGVSVLPVLAAGVAIEGDALLVLDGDAEPLASLVGQELGDATVEGFWRALMRLDALAVTLGRVDGDGLYVRADGSAVIGSFGDGALAADRVARLADRAQLLVATALAVGRDRAVETALRSLGRDRLEAILPYLQRAALDPVAWRAVKARDWDLEDLRVLAEQATGSAPPELEQLRRVTWGSLLRLAVIGFVIYAIISAVSDVGVQTIVDEFRSADLTWVLIALLLSPISQLPQALSTLGATLQPLRFFPALMLQYGVQFIQLAVPSSAARVALEIRFFERVGLPAAGAVSVGMIDSVSLFVVQILLIAVITLSGLASLHLFSSGTQGSAPEIDWQAVAIGVLLLVLAFAAALLVPRVRAFVRRFVDGLRAKAADGRVQLRVLRDPRKLLFLFGGNFLAQVVLAVILGLCLKAFGSSLNLAELLLVNTVVSLFAGFMPVPGGVGVAEAAYTATLSALGVPQAAAASTALMYRLVTFYIPPVWGGLAMRWMRQNRYL